MKKTNNRKWRLHRQCQVAVEEALTGISILKPLIGVDPHLYENLETFFKIDYPLFELIFCIEEEIDPAVMVVRSLLEKYPKVDAKLFIGSKRVGVNPKVNNMLQGYEAASYELILISDGGLRMNRDTLKCMTLALRENVGVVHQLPFVSDREGFAAVLEKVYFGTQFGKMYLSCDFLGINCITGMSCLFRRSVLDEAGGLKALGQYLAEDYYLGKIFLDKGWKISICSQTAMQNPGTYSVSSFQARMTRWAKLRSAVQPFIILLEPASECLLCGLIASWVMTVLFGWSPVAFFFVHVLVWFVLDYILLRVIQNGPLPFSKTEFVIGWLFRECTSWYLLLRAHSSPILKWRSKHYLVKSSAQAEEIRIRSIV
ncbi:Ceramide glucosyltransferase [Lamellibrachia satsuma]|nr:Ceramide glucosyltransferase [Lamellibrachia satsuma]